MSADHVRDADERPPLTPLPLRAKLVAGVLLLIPMLALAIVPSYSSLTPKLWGFPFFYWYQLLWVFIAAGLLGISYLIIRVEDRRRRAEVRDAAPTSDTPTGDRRFRS
jgi:hypothetical protein